MSIRSLLPSLWSDQNDGDIFNDLQREVDRVFNQFRGQSPLSNSSMNKKGDLITYIPKINVSETDKQYEVEIELPGVAQENVEVSVLNQSLVIEGHKQSESTKEEKNYRLVERSEGSFQRVIPLGFDVDDKDVEARFKDGILVVSVQKPEELTKKPKKIEVKKAEAV